MALDLIRSYLSNRCQWCLEPPGYSWDRRPTRWDFIHPLIPYIHKWFLQPSNCFWDFWFADDTSLFQASLTIIGNVNKLSKDISIISDYFRINKLTFNLEKTNVIHFRKPSIQLLNSSVLSFNGITIKCVSCLKYLGLIIDQQLNWKEHIIYLGGIVSSRTGLTRKLRFLPKKVLRTLYTIRLSILTWPIVCHTPLTKHQLMSW